MIKNLVGIEFKAEDRIIKLICDNDCPLTHLKEALFQFQKYVGQIEDQIKISQEKVEAEKLEKECKEKPPCPSSE